MSSWLVPPERWPWLHGEQVRAVPVAAARRYADFWHVTDDALVFAANRLKLTLSPGSRTTLMNEFLSLSVWPDVMPALESIRRSGVRLALLSNFTPRMLAANIASAGLHGIFDPVLSTDQVKSYKPDPRAYQIGVDALKTRREQVLAGIFAAVADLQRSMNNLARWSAIPLRLIVGYGFMAHGYAKMARGPGQFVGVLHALGVPAAQVMGWTTIVVELVGGLAVLVGALVPLVSLPMSAVLLVAMFKVHLAYGFSSIKLLSVTEAGPQFGRPGYEVNLLYLACLATLVLGGSGPWAVDGLLASRRAKK